MLLSVLVPAFNEVHTIETLIEKLLQVNYPIEIIIVDDGSTDGTKEYLKSINQRNIFIFYHKENKGKGAAIKTALSKATGQIITIQDADLEYDPQDYQKMIPLILNGYEVVYGSRILKKTNQYSYKLFYLGGRFITKATNFLYAQKLTDAPTCYKMFKADLIKSIHLNSKGFEFCSEITAKISILGYKIPEVPIHYSPRTIEEGKKIKWTDGVIGLWVLLKYRFISRKSILKSPVLLFEKQKQNSIETQESKA